MAVKGKAAAKNGSGVVQNVATLDTHTPIPLEYHSPSAFLLRKSRRYIPFLEPKDNFAQLLIEAKTLSPTNLACVNSKAEYCLGSGWKLTDVEQDDELTKWASFVNKKGDTLNDVILNAFEDFYTHGNAFIQIVRGKIGSSRFVKVFNSTFLDTRLAMPENDDVPDNAYISKEFRRQGIWTLKDDNVVELPLYGGDVTTQRWLNPGTGDEHIVIHLKNRMTGYDWYGMPSNIACLPQQMLEYKVARFNMDNFDNNLVLGGLVILQGNLTQEESDKLAKNIVFQHSGDGKRGRFVILSSESGIENSKIEPFERTYDGDFIEYDKRLEEKILFSNSWSKMLIDPVSAGLGDGGKMLKEIFEIKNKTLIQPAQNFMLDKFILPLIQICDDWMGKRWSQHKWAMQTESPLSFIGDIDINSILTKDEGRKAIGYPEVGGAEGAKWIKSGSPIKPTSDVPN
jgi:hypothetical protein